MSTRYSAMTPNVIWLTFAGNHADSLSRIIPGKVDDNMLVRDDTVLQHTLILSMGPSTCMEKKYPTEVLVLDFARSIYGRF